MSAFGVVSLSSMERQERVIPDRGSLDNRLYVSWRSSETLGDAGDRGPA